MRGGCGPDIDAFLEAGHTGENVFEVVLGIAMMTISNCMNHITGTELDEQFAGYTWLKKASPRGPIGWT